MLNSLRSGTVANNFSFPAAIVPLRMQSGARFKPAMKCAGSAASWRAHGESNPAYQDENLVSCPIDDGRGSIRETGKITQIGADTITKSPLVTRLPSVFSFPLAAACDRDGSKRSSNLPILLSWQRCFVEDKRDGKSALRQHPQN